MTRTLVAVALAGLAASAQAAITAYVTPGPFSSESGVCTVTFDGSGGANACSGASVAYSGLGSSSLRTGSAAGVALQPAGSTGNFLTVGPTDGSPVTITLTAGTPANYFGFLAGSLDAYNSVTFGLVNSATASLTYTGTEIATLADFAANGNPVSSIYFNLRLDDDVFYDRITLTSTANALETDNHAFGVTPPRSQAPVPAPGGLALLGAGFLAAGVAGRQRRHRA